ncbi:UDP-N-acetylmuramoyl-tripeptide--D-alanyl-D-alanine ligase [Anianabacter salinae]|uniref:UDP-N-acetylmuramoyl-tripeptide--D-alanyl-D- alanine ligase n=1 Tax=Anianabacter salinae TaxID=2851023 RepID=UPI00225E0686|nr:UDP-N-acetylmuramoyl-tripeptide--D-alanyl-D-alanine ligase [Anianabacter salinae]MBV0914074.1 UDP-N-acetylmuramoyl-tripeptide--D-alanyl-D-alanine ligase [Anianabacter salinae]
MTPLWTAAEAASATGGDARGDWKANGVSIDTRTLAPGDLFVALKDVRDGHDFVAAALDKGGGAALVSHVPDGVAADAPLLVVPDVLKALEDLGRAARARCAGRIVAITGSVGKTSTKEMLRAALAAQGRIHAAEASYNNHWGVPLTLARMPPYTDIAIIEIGMNHPGEIAPLARLARPHVALITTVAAAHLEAFESLEGIAREKASIFEGLEPGGIAIVNGDLPVTPILLDAARRAGATVRTFGTARRNFNRLAEVHLSDDCTVGKGRLWRTPVMFRLNTAGRHFALNAMAVLSAVRAAGADVAIAANDLGRWEPPAGRGTRETIVMDAVEDHIRFDLIDDAFNANPASVAAALEVLAAATPVDGVGRVGKGRRIAILGDMLELGPHETVLHRDLADLPAMRRLGLVHCVGPRMRHLFEALPEEMRGHWAETAETLARRAGGLMDAGDVVLVKGSKGSKVSLVVDALRKLGQPLADETRGT